jgi:hypothetical protein
MLKKVCHGLIRCNISAQPSGAEKNHEKAAVRIGIS